jgi:hypothetical protein
MKKQDIISRLESDKGDTDYVLRTATEEQSFLENHKNSIIETELPKKVSEIHTHYDDDVFQILGKRKRGDQKTYDFVKEEMAALKLSATKAEKLEQEIAELRKGNPGTEKAKAEIKELEDKIAALNLTHEQELNNLRMKMQGVSVSAEVTAALGGLKIKSTIPKSAIDVYVNSITSELTKNAEIRDGKMVFLDPATKTPLRNPTTLIPYSTSDLVAEKMKEFIDAGIQQKGPGIDPTKPPVTKDKDGKAILNFTRPATVTSREKLGDWLVKEQGLKRTSPEYRSAYAELSEGLPIAD